MTSLERKILRYQDAYYNDQPLVSDDVYDALYDEQKRIDPDSFVLKIVGAAPKGGWSKANHRIPMGSLDKANSIEDVKKWYSKAQMVMSEKLDGISIAVEYKNGKFHRAITRGRTNEPGEVITRNVSLMQGVVKTLPIDLPEVWIRAEIVCKHSDYEKYFKTYDNPRNCASGVARREGDGYEECCHLTLMPYRIYNIGSRIANSRLEEFELLKKYGFDVPFFCIVNNINEIDSLYNSYIDMRRSEVDYDIDGLVIEIDDFDMADELGETNGKPKGSIAFKFPYESAPTILRNIRWQVGNSGRITPVGDFDPVDLAGVRVKQATLHNPGRVKDLKLFEGCSILASRRNDCIPAIEANISLGISVDDLPVYVADNDHDYFLPPESCPVCGYPLETNGEYLMCYSEDCPAQVAGMMRRWIAKLNIIDFGNTVIDAVIDANMAVDIADLYDLDPNKVALLQNNNRYIGENGRKAIKNLNEKKELSLDTFVGSLGIPLWGRSMVKTIMDAGYNTLDKLFEININELNRIHGVGDGRAEAFTKGMNDRKELIYKILSKGVTIKSNSGNLNGLSFVFSGFRDAGMQEVIESKGGTMKDGISKNVTYLVSTDPNSTTGKAQKARELGIKIISVEEMKQMIE